MGIGEWISIKDRLPEKDGIYIVFVKCTDGDTISILYYTNKYKFSHLPVTHWMPLPDAPK